MLTMRQIDVITYLINCDGWVNGEQLTQHFRLDKKTLLSELKAIETELGKECEIESGRKGYHLKSLSDRGRRKIHDESAYYGGRSSLGVRPSAFVLYLLFQKDYTSMQQLADLFYLSKTAVALEIETVKRWIDRYDGLELEISGTKGIRILASEQRKRIYCAKFGSRHAFQSVPFDSGIIKDYTYILDTVEDILQDALSEMGLLLAGEDFYRNARYIASCVLRSRFGYEREEEPSIPSMYDALIDIIRTRISQEIAYDITQAEQNDFALLLAQGSRLNMTPIRDPLRERLITEQLSCMEERICEILAIPCQPLYAERDAVAQHISGMLLRSRSGNVALNHYNDEIVCRYPLDVHLTSCLLPEFFDLHSSKETSFLALYLSTGLNRIRGSVSVLLVSNQNPSIICQIKSALCGFGSPAVNCVHILPSYALARNSEICQRHDILLTTDHEVLLNTPGFYLVPCILTSEDVRQLDLHFKNRAAERKEERKVEVLDNVYRHQTVSSQDVTLEELIGTSKAYHQSCHSVGLHVLYICRIGPDECRKICVYDLDKPIMVQHKRIRRIIFTSFREGEAGMLDFFDIVADLIADEL